MENLDNDNKGSDDVKTEGGGKKGFFASGRLIFGVLITLVLLWCVWTVFGFFDDHFSDPEVTLAPTSHPTKIATDTHTAPDAAHQNKKAMLPGKNQQPSSQTNSPAAPSYAKKENDNAPKSVAVPHVAPSVFSSEVPGITFVTACIKPLDYELNERFWGWRPNDMLRVTDNVNNFQLGVLEVTRRTTVALAETISRTGSTAAYVPSLEFAMNWFMIKPTKYWFPSAESKYQEGLDELRNYLKMLNRGEAPFYRRVDNLVPLFKAYESILGSCDENLVKNLGEISFFKADDYFYYTKGVASAMATILEATAEEFHETIESVQGADVLHHAVEALHHAAHTEPLIVLEGSPSSLLANHRANMAAPISHARFYLGVLNVALTGNI
ncbi:DUF2333 domain-containing protein [Desulfonema ishimotonii]|uniref:DUF2333 domain-containing protein n=1 Tax=Desulfonema ishimotonii TaxID=45657 RepID=A0A401G1M0_9BACT|nr:DUF2333 family protein [Desulfonema ishimotonii]GBC63120.1 DUF2333 domain-containing protein [Desulfonema ishimotonii]